MNLGFFILFFLPKLVFAQSLNEILAPKNPCIRELESFAEKHPPRIFTSPLKTTGVELEIEIDDESPVLDLITTQDGTVGALFPYRPLPAWFKDWAKTSEFKFRIKRKILFLDLPRKIRRWLLLDISLNRVGKHDYNHIHRAIPYVRVVDWIKLTFEKETFFLGRYYQPGEYFFRSKDFLKQTITYMNPFQAWMVKGVELSFQTTFDAGATSEFAKTFLKALKLPETHQHVHLSRNLLNTSFDPSLKFLDQPDSFLELFFAAWALETLSHFLLITEGYGLKDVMGSSDFLYFNVADSEDLGLGFNRLEMFFYYLIDKMIDPKEFAFWRHHLPFGAVSMTLPGKYDDSSLAGLEMRMVPPDPVVKGFYEAYLSQTQKLLQQTHFQGLYRKVFLPWLKDATEQKEYFLNEKRQDRSLPLRVDRILNQIIFHSTIKEIHWLKNSWKEQMAWAPSEFQQDALALFYYPATPHIKGPLTEAHPELGLLVHDWSKDPLLGMDEKLQAGIRQAQHKALARLRAIPAQNLSAELVVKILQSFLAESEILKTYLVLLD